MSSFTEDVFRQAVIDHAMFLGIDPVKEDQYLWLAEEALMAQLPSDWEIFDDEASGQQYFYNSRTGQSTWDNPLDEPYRRLFIRLKYNPSSNRHLREEDWGSFPGEKKILERVKGPLRFKQRQMSQSLGLDPDDIRSSSDEDEGKDIEQFKVPPPAVPHAHFQNELKAEREAHGQIVEELKNGFQNRNSSLEEELVQNAHAFKSQIQEQEVSHKENVVKYQEESEFQKLALQELKIAMVALKNSRSLDAGKSVAAKMGLEKRLSDMTCRNQELELELSRLITDQEQSQSNSSIEHIDFQTSIRTLENNSVILQEKIQALERERERLCGERDVLKVSVDNLKLELHTELDSNLANQKRTSDLETLIDQYKRDMKKTEQTGSSNDVNFKLQVSRLQEERDAAFAELQRIKEETPRTEFSFPQTSNDLIKTAIDKLTLVHDQQMEVAAGELASVKRSLVLLEEQLHTKTAQLVASVEESESHQRKEQRLEAECNVLQNSLEKVKSELHKEFSENDRLKKVVFDTKDLLEATERKFKVQENSTRESQELELRTRGDLESKLSLYETKIESLQNNLVQVKDPTEKEREISKLKEQLFASNTQYSKQGSEVSQLECTLQKIKQELIVREEQVASANNNILVLQDHIDSLERSKDRQESDKNLLNDSLACVKSELKTEILAQGELRKENNALRAQTETLKRGKDILVSSHQETFQATIAVLEKNSITKDATITELTCSLDSISGDRESALTSLKHCEIRLEQVLTREQDLKIQIAHLEGDNIELQFKAHHEGRSQELQSKLQESLATLRKKQHTIEDLQLKLNDVENNLSIKESDIRKLIESKDATNQTLKNQLKTCEDEVHAHKLETQIQLDSLSKQLNDFQNLYKEAKTSVQQAASQKEFLDSELAREQKRVAELKQLVNECDLKIKSLERHLEEAAFKASRNEQTKFEEQISKLIVQNECLHQELLQSEAKAASSSDLLVAQETKLQMENKELELALSQCKQEMEQVQSNAAAENQVAALSLELERCKETLGNAEVYRQRAEALKLSQIGLQANMEALKVKAEAEVKLRRKLHNKIVDLQGNIRVYCRIRPVLSHVVASGQADIVVNVPFEGEIELHQSLTCRDQMDKFEFDQVFRTSSTQQEVYAEVEPLIESSLDGYNVCIFAYGQTGSGKTFTMDGEPTNRGVNYRTFETLFLGVRDRESKQNAKFTVSLSMLEIYNECIKDLLDETKKKLEVRQGDFGLHVPGLVQETVSTAEQVEKLMARGIQNRTVGSHNANAHSSRSHLVVTVSIVGEYTKQGKCMVTRSKLNLIDLAGSERLNKTEATGAMLEEAKSINKSLSALGNVMQALSKTASGSNHIPFRDSKLTFLLQDS